MIKTLILVLTMACAATAGAQQPVTYQPSRDSTWLQSLNIFKMYFVRAGDTLGESVHAFSVERHAWLHGTGRSYELRRLRLDVARKVDTDTLRWLHRVGYSPLTAIRRRRLRAANTTRCRDCLIPPGSSASVTRGSILSVSRAPRQPVRGWVLGRFGGRGQDVDRCQRTHDVAIRL